MLNELAHNF